MKPTTCAFAPAGSVIEPITFPLSEIESGAGRCNALSSAREIAGVKNKEGTGTEFAEVSGNSSSGHGVYVETLANVPGTRLPETRKTWFCADAPFAWSSLTVRK